MAGGLPKQTIDIPFSQGLDTKTDPFRVPIGKFESLSNSIFDKIGQLTKRNGFGSLTALPNSDTSYLTTFSSGLLAIGSDFLTYSQGSDTWVNKGSMTSVQLEAIPAIRSSASQTQADIAIASNGFACVAYTETDLVTNFFKYAIFDSTTGQNIVAPTSLIPSAGAVTGSPKVFLLGNYFIIVFTVTITAADHLQYIAINITDPTVVTAASNITSAYTKSTKGAWDGVVANNSLYLAWNGSDMGGAIRMTFIDSTLTQHNTVIFAGNECSLMSVSADTSGSSAIIYAAFYANAGPTGYVLAVNQQLNTILAPTQWLAAGTVENLTSYADSGSVTIFYELLNAYSYDSGIASDYIKSRSCTQAGVLGTAAVVARSVGLASKPFAMDGVVYLLSVYAGALEPTFFLINAVGQVVAKLAYSNAGGYIARGLPNVNVSGTTASVAYLFKDLIQAVNKTQGVANPSGVYAQNGINLASFDFTTSQVTSSEIGGALHLNGGFLWMYDGVIPVEHGFHLWPEDVEVTTDTSGGAITAQQYFYVATYEWTDASGMIHRSAPSVPFSITTTGSTSTNTIDVPTLRLTYKINNPVRIVIYRWSVAQQTYYQVTPMIGALLNDPAVDSVSFDDTLADSAILGNNILYTTGGVVENIEPPAVATMGLFKSRLFYVSAEDGDLVGFSKQVIENTPVETSDLFTKFIAPTTGAQGPVGKVKVLSAMDDKVIFFKKNAIYYMVGTGPDNTGANDDFSEPTFITAAVGCENQNSVVLMPKGLMFQSDKGIWLLDRGLGTSYIGFPVAAFNNATVLSALTIPETNQVRFTLDNGITLMYDYYYDQWATFVNIPAVSSTLYQNLHTYVNSRGQVFQESPGLYLDGSRPVLMSFVTSWINIAGLQGFERFYFMYLLGTYLSPFKLNMQIAYDYASSAEQTTLVTPDVTPDFYGDETLYGGGSPYGGPSEVFRARVFPKKQKCEAFQIQMQEVYDPSYGVMAGAGLTLSGLSLIVGMKKGYRTQSSKRSFG